MHITVVAVGKIRERYLQEGIAEYEKRLRPYVHLHISEIRDEPGPARGSSPSEIQIRERQGDRILLALPPEAHAIALTITGESWSSEELAGRLLGWEVSGKNSIAFILGGDRGLSDTVLARCSHHLSLSQMTFTYQMARLILVEQIYRGFRIMRGEPYHK